MRSLGGEAQDGDLTGWGREGLFEKWSPRPQVLGDHPPATREQFLTLPSPHPQCLAWCREAGVSLPASQNPGYPGWAGPSTIPTQLFFLFF